PIVATLFAVLYALLILAFPPSKSITRKFSIIFLACPISVAFFNHTKLYPNAVLCSMFGRFLLIWFAHMSHMVCIVEYAPTDTTPTKDKQEDLDWKQRTKQAWTVLFDYDFNGRGAQNSAKHSHARTGFLLHHLNQIVMFYSTMSAYETCVKTYIPFLRKNFPVDPSIGQHLTTLYDLFKIPLNWSIISMLHFELYHSVFALLFVGLGLDAHHTWSLALFGSIKDAWSVRRYWGKYWHKYVYYSFSAHVRAVTRGWMCLQKGCIATRLLENTLVFTVSGLMHSMVSYVEFEGRRDVWSIAFWFTAQMLPIVLETLAQKLWTAVLGRASISRASRQVRIFERIIGYLWVLSWFMWSIPVYEIMRDGLTLEMMRRRAREA
ncbi:hypothetical protein P154DRAFT_402868, partial [Amniculicola lignicola CBS 123094]